MKSRFIKFVLIILLVVFSGLFSSLSVSAETSKALGFDDAIERSKEVIKKDDIGNPTSIVTTGLKYLMYAVGVISVVMIIVGGIRYATSGGAAEKVKSAKNTILYACVGLAVALLSLAIVTFINKKTGEMDAKSTPPPVSAPAQPSRPWNPTPTTK